MKRILMLAVLTVSLGISASAQIITNGSFEDAPCNTGEDLLFPGELPSWTIIGSPNYILVYCGGGAASNGSQSIDLLQTGSIIQDIPTSVGVLYRVTFDLSGRNLFPTDSVRTFAVTADGASAVNYERIVTPNYNLIWEQRTYDFVASGGTTTLAFTSTTGGSYYGPALDNIVATAIGGNVCHSNNGSAPFSTLNLSPRAFTAHINHGDQMGACP